MSFQTILEEWPKVLKILRDVRPSTHALLMEGGQPVSFDANTLKIGYKDGYGIHKELISSDENKELVRKTISSHFHKKNKCRFYYGRRTRRGRGM